MKKKYVHFNKGHRNTPLNSYLFLILKSLDLKIKQRNTLCNKKCLLQYLFLKVLQTKCLVQNT